MRMRVRFLLLLSAAVTVAFAAADRDLGASPPDAVAKPKQPPPARLLVTAREFRLTLSRTKLVAGPAVVQLYNFGEDPHDLRLRRVGGSRVFAIGEVEPREMGERTMRLRRGSRYRLWCSLAAHAERGMTASLRTTSRTARQRAKAGRRRR